MLKTLALGPSQQTAYVFVFVQISAHVRGCTSNNPITRAQADNAQIGMTNRRRSVADKLGAGCAVAQLNTSQRKRTRADANIKLCRKAPRQH